MPVSRSRAEIEDLLRGRKASTIGCILDRDRVVIGFECDGRRVRMTIVMPKLIDFQKRPNPHWEGHFINVAAGAAQKAYEQEERRIWRALLLTLKAKFEAIESKIETFDEAFLPHVVLPGGQTMGEWATPQIADAYAMGSMPPLLPAPR